MAKFGFVVLAAGKGTRMYSSLPKVLHTILGKSMLEYVLDALTNIPDVVVWTVVGHGADAVKAACQSFNTEFVIQEQQHGTGHALQQVWEKIVASNIDYVCVVNGDTPVVPIDTIFSLKAKCVELNAAMGFVSIDLENPFGYGRVLRTGSGQVATIVEQKDFDINQFENEIFEVNAGVYVLHVNSCADVLALLDQDNAQGEFYITQLVPLNVQLGRIVLAEKYSGASRLFGVNSPRELVDLEEAQRCDIVENHLARGVLIRNKDMVSIGPDVIVEPGVEIVGPCEIYGRSFLGSGTMVASHCWLKDATLHACQVKSFSHIESATVFDGASVGPYARLRPGSVVHVEAKVGNFVEIKKSILQKGAKAGHLSYIGDSDVGAGVNIGAGTITCNYDGITKHKTIIKDNAFIGSNTALVAPVTIGQNALVGAGSVVTKDVPDASLCVARARQVNLDRKYRLK